MGYDFKKYLWGDQVSRIITINSVVWIVVSIGMLSLGPAGQKVWIGLLGVPAQVSMLPFRAWTLVTYMFTQVDFLHMLVNMMWLLIFGRMVEYFLGAKKLLGLYLVSGLAGSIAFVVCNAISPGMHSLMYGASCAVIGVIGYATISTPHWHIGLLFLGPVKILWIALAAIVLFVVLEPSLYVSIAHAAGLVVGVLYGLWRRYPVRIMKWVNKLLPRRKLKEHTYKMPKSYSRSGLSPEAELDQLLDKVNRSGYSSLTPSQRQRLFELSQRLKR